MNCHPAA